MATPKPQSHVVPHGHEQLGQVVADELPLRWSVEVEIQALHGVPSSLMPGPTFRAASVFRTA